MKRFSLTDHVLDNAPRPYVARRKPRWLRAALPRGDAYRDLLALVHGQHLHTVCEEARCPNLGECWSAGVATLMILGEVCTRSCGFCHVKTGRPSAPDDDEPRRVGQAVATMNLRHVVITSVDRDDLPDGGAGLWARTIAEVRRQSPDTRIEVLIPDFRGDRSALQTVFDARPDVLNHNLETVRRLYPAVRPQAKYDRSLELLTRAKQQDLTTKTGIMVGIGETDDEIDRLMAEVIERTGCAMLTIGQYLQPTPMHLPVARFVAPEQFNAYRRRGLSLGFDHVESGPLVRSSYHADHQARMARR